MATHAKTFTVGTSAIWINDPTGTPDLTSAFGGGFAIAASTNTGDIWFSLNPLSVVPTVEGDDCAPIAPGERVPIDTLPMRLIASTGGNKLTISPV